MLTAHLNQKLTALIPKGEKFAIAFSGGGDSTALVHALKDHPQARHIYIVDHALRKGSATEANAAKAFALTCGYDVKLLKWKHNSPTTAIQEKARIARYALMGEQCRKDNIQYLLTAHSEDDQAETLLMRYERKTDWRGAAGMAELSYGPVWPKLALVNIVRPLLNVTRQELRDYNLTQGLGWTEDPSNQNRNYARIRARDDLKNFTNMKAGLLTTAADMRAALEEEKKVLREQFISIAQMNPNGYITLADVPLPELMLHMLRAVSGHNGLVDRAKIKRLVGTMRGKAFKSGTLAGALIARLDNGFVMGRDPVAVKGRRDNPKAHDALQKHLGLRLKDEPQIWDGRFIVHGSPTCHLGTVHAHASNLSKVQKTMLQKIPAIIRPTLPIMRCEAVIKHIGYCDGHNSEGIISLIRPRLEASLGGKLA